MSDQLRTDRTYATHHNAVMALVKACEKLGLNHIHDVRWLIAARVEDGVTRFAPVVIYDRTNPNSLNFAHLGITIVG